MENVTGIDSIVERQIRRWEKKNGGVSNRRLHRRHGHVSPFLEFGASGLAIGPVRQTWALVFGTKRL